MSALCCFGVGGQRDDDDDAELGERTTTKRVANDSSDLGVTKRSKAVTEILRRRTQVFNRSTSSPTTSMSRTDSKTNLAAAAAAAEAKLGPLADKDDYAKILATLEKLPLFSRGVLSPEVRQSIVQRVRVRKVQAAAVLILEYDVVSGASSEMYIVKEGSFGVYQTRSGSRVLVNKKGCGDFFGEIALLYNCPRTASIVAQEDSIVWVLDRRTFKAQIRRRQQLIKREQSKLITFLNSVYIFQKLDGVERDELATKLEEIEVACGDEVLGEGELPEHLFIVREGAAVLWRSVSNEMTRTDILFPGDFFGFKCYSFNNTKTEPRVTAGGEPGEKLVLLRVPADAVSKLPEHVHRRMRRKLKAFSTRERFLRLASSRTIIQLNVRDLGAPGNLSSSMHGSLEDATLIDNDSKDTPQSDDTSTPQPRSEKGRNGGARYELSVEVEGIIGSGAYSIIKLVRCPKQQRTFAMKCINKLEAARIKEHIFCERTIGSMILHPLFVRLYGCFQSDVELTMLYDYVHGGDLMDLLETHAHFVEKTGARVERGKGKRTYLRGFESEDLVRFYGASVAAALQYLHSLGIVYRDLKPENVFIDMNGYIKLGDFGFAKQINNDMTYTFCGTPSYLAPECIYSNGYDMRIDWWSFGVLLYVIATGSQPFSNESNTDEPAVIIGKIVGAEFDVQYPPYLSRSLLALLKSCMCRDVEQRLGTETVQTHVFFKDKIDFDELVRGRIPGPDVSGMRVARDKRIESIVREMAAVSSDGDDAPHSRAPFNGGGDGTSSTGRGDEGGGGGIVTEGQPLDDQEIARLNEIFMNF